MSFQGPIYTDAGKALHNRPIGTGTLKFTKMQMGDGSLGGTTIAALTALINPLVTMEVQQVKQYSDYIVVTAPFTNATITTAFNWRKIGLFAADPDYPNDRTKDVLFCYQNAYSSAASIPPGSQEFIERLMNIPIKLSDVSDVTITISASLIYALKNPLTGKIYPDDIPDLNYIAETQKGAANGVASLNANGKVPSRQLPSMGILPQIRVTTNAGATVTATYSGQTITGSAGEDGMCMLDIPSYGTWLCEATLSGKTSKSASVTVDTVKQYYASCSFVVDLATSSWAEIAEYAPEAASKYAEGNPIWNIGDERQITLTNGEVITVKIADFNHDHNAGTILPVTFIMKDCLLTTYKMNADNTNYGGWPSSDLFSILVNTIYPKLPDDLRAVIQKAYKTSAYITESGGSGSGTNVMDIWFLAEDEVSSTASLAIGSGIEGTIYPIFTDDASRIKKVNDVASNWWLRSCGRNASYMCRVKTDGVPDIAVAQSQYGVAFGFCI
ncbi:hypothetical protein OBV_22720 [Oscillibacter valericigenes Sjm18-20]|nr:hypothetical protein OBV_22720 [Oscillibacter valericigenes Sjm18-20]